MVIETNRAGQQTLNTAAQDQSIKLQVRTGDGLGRGDQELEGGGARPSRLPKGWISDGRASLIPHSTQTAVTSALTICQRVSHCSSLSGHDPTTGTMWIWGPARQSCHPRRESCSAIVPPATQAGALTRLPAVDSRFPQWKVPGTPKRRGPGECFVCGPEFVIGPFSRCSFVQFIWKSSPATDALRVRVPATLEPPRLLPLGVPVNPPSRMNLPNTRLECFL